LTLITVDTHIDAWLAASLAGFDLVLFGLGGMIWGWMRTLLQGVSTLHVVVTVLSVLYATSIRRLQSIAHIRLLLTVFTFAAAVAVFANGHAVIVTHD